MRILDDAAEAGAHEFAVELEPEGETEGGQVLVRCAGGKADTAAVRAALERFNAAPGDGWRWTADALAAYLLHELCGIALLDRREPPSGAA